MADERAHDGTETEEERASRARRALALAALLALASRMTSPVEAAPAAALGHAYELDPLGLM